MGNAVTDKDARIMNRIQEHLEFYHENYPNEWVGIFLQGSQNYGLDTASSDIDTKIIVLPGFEDVILNRKPVSHTLVLPNNEHCDVKDIRLMFDCFKKQNVNFLEILFTKWFAMNPEYEDLFYTVIHNRERIADYNNYAAVECMNGMILQKHKSMFKPTPATQSVIDQYGYNGKDLCHMIRIFNFMLDRFVSGKSFEECLQTAGAVREEASMAKGHEYTLKEATFFADYLDSHSHLWRGRIFEVLNEINYSPDYSVDTMFQEVLKNILTHAFRKELVANEQ